MAKRSSSSSDTKKKSKKKSSKKGGPNAVAMKVKSVQKENPFETIWSRRKFDILGKKRKGEERRIGQARIHAIEKRKKTLLKEYQQSGKASVFLDKRIGEQNDSLAEFDKAILRSQRERQMKIKKTSKYNLSDGEEEEFEGYGEGKDDFDEEVEHDSEDDVDQVNDGNRSSVLKQLKTVHGQDLLGAGLSEEEDNRPKSKKEVMEEVIMKSKFFKAQKAREKEENEKLVEQLDKDFESLVQSQAFSSLTQPNKMKALKSLVNPNFSQELGKKAVVSICENSKQDEPDSYDKLVSEMVFEMRARPSDRTKTPEEVAEEEKERLEQLEQERQNRMLATDDVSDEDNDSDSAGNQSAKMSTHISGDDLGDSFTIDEKSRNKKGWVDDILERNHAEDSEDEDDESSEDSGDAEDDEGETKEDEEEDEQVETLKDWEQSDDDIGADFGEHDSESDEEERVEDDETHCRPEDKKNDIAVTSARMGKRKTGVSGMEKAKGGKQTSRLKLDLPFKIDAPTNMDELRMLFEGRSDEDIIEAIRRIRVCNAIPLAAENRKKTQVFYGLLLQYFATLANEKPLNFQLLNLLVKPLMEMSAEIPYFSAICARERILRTRTKFCEDVKDPDKSCWPSLKTLFLLRLWSMIFPCSDFRHAVMTPAILLMCEYLMRCPVLSVRDAAVGSFLCSIVLSVTKQSQKFCPEALMFLKALVLAAMEKDPRSSQGSQFDHLIELKTPMPLLHIQEPIEEVKPLHFLKIMNLPEDAASFNTDGFRGSVLMSVVETIEGFVDIYKELKAFPEIFLPMSQVLTKVAEQQNMPECLREKVMDVSKLIRTKVEDHHKLRQPLQMRKQKPVPIKLLNPKFEESYVKGRDYDPDRARAERRKLQKLHKKEAKGAQRELRKDNYFLLGVKETEKLQREEERAEMYGKAKAFLQEQEHAYKSGQLGKGRKRKR